MDSSLAPTKEDLRSVLKLEYRKRQEQMRKERIFNPRQRLIGIDKKALDELVQEKQHQNVYKQKEEICFSLKQNRLNELFDSQLEENRAEQMRIQCEINEFRQRFQQKEQAREFDLNDPLYLRKTSTNDSLHWIGLDPGHIHRKKLQQEQLKSWLKQQIHEKINTKAEANNFKRTIEINALNQEAQMRDAEQSKQLKRRQNQFDTAKFNQSLVQAQKQKRLEDKRNEEEDNLAEIMNNLCSDMLTENKEYGNCLSLFGGSRVTPSMYRGMADDQLNEIQCEQLRQIEEKRYNKAKQKEADQNFDKIAENHLKFLEIEYQEIQNKRNQCFALQNSTNMQLQSQQKQRNNHLNKEVYKFTPNEDYFDQFNRTSR